MGGFLDNAGFVFEAEAVPEFPWFVILIIIGIESLTTN